MFNCSRYTSSLVVKTRVPRPRPPKTVSKNAHTYRAQNKSLQKTSFQALLIVINTTDEVGINMRYKKNFSSWKQYFFNFFQTPFSLVIERAKHVLYCTCLWAYLKSVTVTVLVSFTNEPVRIRTD